MAADPLWQLDAVSLGPARLHEVSLSVHRGVTAIVGWSGAGKTSLLNLLVGFEAPSGGRIVGAPRVVWVPQSGGLWAHCTAREHLEIARHAKDGIGELLAAFDLTDKAGARPHELSEGEQSRLAVARALAADAEVLVMDEPLVHVDPARAGNYWRVIRRQLSASGASLVFATHEPEAVLAEAERAVCLSEGRLLHEGLVTELYAHPPNAELMSFLGPGNWLSPEDARQWLGLEIGAPRCFRPEQLMIEPVADGSARVTGARFMGSVAEVELFDPASMQTRLFFHRPGSASLAAGMGATIRVP
jgi:ABC-type Fe3+/spermidine/putrescine transport system ATPase subunit